MSEERCEYCGLAVPYDEIEYGWCPECIDEVTHDTGLMLKYICDSRNKILKNTLEHDFFVNYCYNANDTECSRELMLLCKENVLRDIRLGANRRAEMLTAYVNDDLSSYLEWVVKNDKAEHLTKKQEFDRAVREAIAAITASTAGMKLLEDAIREANAKIKEKKNDSVQRFKG